MRVLRVVLVLLIALLAWLQYRLWFGHGGAGEVQQLSAQVDKQKRDNAGLHQRNAEVAAEVEDLKSGEAAVEERARSELGMIKQDEVFFQLQAGAVAKPPTPAAKSAPTPAATIKH